ncbi:hypothetical protein ILYODFUR_035707 [Ilyodon furcidens]|uniref:Uncharacterized protein n=1 Tax=Ilyodon furcidens TaxID=33524 RepID=A0ABV0U0H5_9TELE
MTSLDPVEEFMSFCQQRDITALVSPASLSAESQVEEGRCSNSCAFIWVVASQEAAVIPFPGCAGRRDPGPR